MEEISKAIKNLFREKINLVITLLILIFSFNIYEYVQSINNFVRIRKKIDHRYFNITKTIEDIYNIEINTLNGEIKKYRN